MDYYEKLYVRTKHNVKTSTQEYPLAFATYFEDNAAFRKRQETVDMWAQRPAKNHVWIVGRPVALDWDEPEEPALIVDNVPIEGFMFEKDVKRYSTSNKWFRIKDPRGFTLEISSQNLTDIILNGHLKNGELIGEYVWTRLGGNNYLIDAGDEDFLVAEQRTLRPVTVKLTIGDKVEISSFAYDTIYLGMAYRSYFPIMNRKITVERKGSSWSTWDRYATEYEYYTHFGKDEKPFYLFAYWDKWSTKGRYKVIAYRSLPKKFTIIGKSEEPAEALFEQIKKQEFFDTVMNNERHYAINFFFRTKEEMMEYEAGREEIVAALLNDDKGYSTGIIFNDEKILVDKSSVK